MGIIVKVYIENNDEEIDILTLNSEDKKSSSVTITASAIKDYLIKNYNSKGEKSRENSLVRSSMAIDESNLNSNVIQSENVTCSHSGILETCTPANEFFSEKIAENTNDLEVISQNLNSNMPLNDIRDCIRVIDDNEANNCVVEQEHSLATSADCVIPDKVLNNGAPSSDRAVEDPDLSTFADSGSSENSDLKDADSSTLGTRTDAHSVEAVTLSHETDCDNNANFEMESPGGKRLKNDESLSNREMRVEPETGAENVIASLKNVSYEVDDFLYMVNTTPTQNNQNSNNLRLSGVPTFLNSPNMYLEEVEDESELEEYFVVEKIAASRFNEESKVLEFLLKAQKCVVRKEPWAPIRTNITDLTISDPKCLFIQCPKGFKSYRRKLQEKFDQYVRFVDMGRGFMCDMPSETISNCPSVFDITTNEFSSPVCADVIVDPQKSLNDACLIEPSLDGKNISPVILPKNVESINDVTDVGLPSAHFYISDMMPGLGDQLVEFVDNNPTPMTNPNSETDISSRLSNTLSSDHPQKEHRNHNKHLQCPQCSYKTVSASALGNHLRHHTKECLRCEFCPKRYWTRKGLKNHEKTHRIGGSLLAENVGTVVSDSFAKTIHSGFVGNVKEELSVKSAFDRNSIINLKRSQSSVILDEAVNFSYNNWFNDRNVECKRKRSSQNQSKKPIGRPKKMKIDVKKEPNGVEIIDLCEDVDPSECVPTDILANAAPIKSEILQECLADTVNAMKTNDLLASVVKSSSNSPISARQEPKETCDVCQKSFITASDLFDHKEQFHKYPIVLLKRLSTSY